MECGHYHGGISTRWSVMERPAIRLARKQEREPLILWGVLGQAFPVALGRPGAVPGTRPQSLRRIFARANRFDHAQDPFPRTPPPSLRGPPGENQEPQTVAPSHLQTRLAARSHATHLSTSSPSITIQHFLSASNPILQFTGLCFQARRAIES